MLNLASNYVLTLFDEFQLKLNSTFCCVTNLTFVNHTPNSEDISIPVNLTVNGESALSWNVEELDLGDVLYQPGWEGTHKKLG